jgi:HEAT repeat protein
MKETLRRSALAAALLPLFVACATGDGSASRPVATYLDRTAESWIEDLRLEDKASREAAVAALVALGPETAPLLAAEIDDVRPAVRYSALAALAGLHEEGVAYAPIAAARLRDPDPSVRAKAAVALSAFGPGGAFVGESAAASALRDDDWFVRFAAIQTLKSYGADAYPEGYEALRAIEHKDRDPQIRAHAKEAIESIGRAHALKTGRSPEARGRRDDVSP